MDAFSLLHLDDSSDDLETFKAFVELNGAGSFECEGVTSVERALGFLDTFQDTHLCIVDFDLQAEHYPGSDEFWDGLSFARVAKFISPNTNFILLSNTRTKVLMQAAAEVGYFGVVKKSDLIRGRPKGLIEYLRYACYYSESFLRRRSDARLNFSQSIAHTLKSTLLTNQSLIHRAEETLRRKTFGEDQRMETAEVLNVLTERNTETILKIDRVLGFYTKLSLSVREACLHCVIGEVIETHVRKDIIECHGGHGGIDGRFDPVLIKLAVENLLDNSAKAVSRQTDRQPLIEVQYRVVEQAGQAFFEVSVIDNGVGLKPSTEGEVNRPFFTADNLEKGIASFGIGCAEAEKIAMVHRNGSMAGSLKVQNREDSPGCIAKLRFPRRTA